MAKCWKCCSIKFLMQWMEHMTVSKIVTMFFFFVICWAWLSPSYTLSLLCVSQNQANQKRRQANVTFLHKYITTIATIEINNWCVIAMQQQRNERRKKNVKKTSHHLSHKTIASAKFCDFCRLLCVSHRRWRSAFNDRRNKIVVIIFCLLADQIDDCRRSYFSYKNIYVSNLIASISFLLLIQRLIFWNFFFFVRYCCHCYCCCCYH